MIKPVDGMFLVIDNILMFPKPIKKKTSMSRYKKALKIVDLSYKLQKDLIKAILNK